MTPKSLVSTIDMSWTIRLSQEVLVVILRGDGNSVTHHELLTWLPKMGRPLLNDTPYQTIHEDTITTLQIKLLKRRLNCEGSNE